MHSNWVESMMDTLLLSSHARCCWYCFLFLFTDCRARLPSTLPYQETPQWFQPLGQAAHLPRVGPDDFVLLQLRSHDRPAMAIQSIVQASNLAVPFVVRTVCTCVCVCFDDASRPGIASEPICECSCDIWESNQV